VVCDFGLAKVTNSAHVLDNQKFHSFVGFSPRYTAPEVFHYSRGAQAPDSEVIDSASWKHNENETQTQTKKTKKIEKKGDVYSLAIIIWELLERKVPWSETKLNQIEGKVMQGERVKPISLPSSLHPSLPFSDPSFLHQPPISKTFDHDAAGRLLLDLMKASWAQDPSTRPPFSAIYQKIASAL